MYINFDKSPETYKNWSKLGFAPETAPLLALLPAVQVAWAEGFLQTSERRIILQIFEELEIPMGRGFHEVLDWLEERPSDEFFDSATDILSNSMVKMESNEYAKLRDFLHRSCLKVADASAKIGLTKNSENICREERKQINKIGRRLGFSFA